MKVMKMRTMLPVVLILAGMLLSVNAFSAKLDDLPMPSLNAEAGSLYEGVRLGLWTEKKIYAGEEIRNVWLFARKEHISMITIGVGGNLYTDSFLYITDAGMNTIKIPIGGGIDGMTNPDASYHGISRRLADLAKGSYSLVWKTNKLKSNTIRIEIQ